MNSTRFSCFQPPPPGGNNLQISIGNRAHDLVAQQVHRHRDAGGGARHETSLLVLGSIGVFPALESRQREGKRHRGEVEGYERPDNGPMEARVDDAAGKAFIQVVDENGDAKGHEGECGDEFDCGSERPWHVG